MSAVEDCADGDCEGFITIAALPTLISPIAARVPPDILALAIRAYRMSVPSGLFKVVNCLFVGLERLEKIEDIHGCTVSFDALPYLNPGFCQVQKRTIPKLKSVYVAEVARFVHPQDDGF